MVTATRPIQRVTRKDLSMNPCTSTSIMTAGLQELEILVRFFVHLITCFRTRSCNSHYVHLKQSFVHACTLICTSPCTYYQDRNISEQAVNSRSIPLTINPQPSLGIQTVFYKERHNERVFCLPRTKQPDNSPSTVFESNEHGRSLPVFVSLKQRGIFS